MRRRLPAGRGGARCDGGGAPSAQPLPDYLAPGLDIVFVGINPGLYSARVGHYFARRTNRFWPAVNAAGIFDPPLGPETDHRALEQGIGFTDVVKRPTATASQLRAADYREGAALLKAKLERYRPRIACFNGITGYRMYLKYAEGVQEPVSPGLQPRTIGDTLVFVVPNPSPANPVATVEGLARWYRRLRALRDRLREGRGAHGDIV